MNMHIYLRTALMIALGVVPLLLSCGGGGGGSTPATPKAPGIYGTAASGLGHSHRPIDGGDKDGNPINGETDGEGNFILPTNGRTPPYLLRVITSTTPTTLLYSVSADENAATTINITPLTDLIIRSWYSAQTPSVNIDYAFDNLPTHPAPKPDSVTVIHNLIKNVVQLWLDKNNVTSSDFNLISTPFTAGTVSIPGTGLDKVLDQAWVNAAAGQIMISNGTTTQNTTLNAFLSSLTASTTTVSVVTGSTVESGNNDMTVVTTDAAKQVALAGINTTLANIANTINARGLFLTAADLLPYLDPSLVNDGFNQAQFAQILRMMALSARASGQTVLYTLKVIKALDTTTNVAEVRLDGIGPAFFKKVSGNWLISGNGRIANIAVSAVMNTRQGINPCPGLCDGTKMTVKVDALQGMISNVTVTGGGFWNSATVPWVSNVAVTGTVINLDRFWLDSNHLANLPAKDTPFQVIVTPVSGPTVTYTIMSNAYTTEPISITNLSGSTIDVAKLGAPLTVTWTKPISFPIQGMFFGYQAYAPSRTAPSPLVCTGGVNLSGTAAPSATVTILPTCQGTNVGSVNLDVVVNGVNGESSTITYVIN